MEETERTIYVIGTKNKSGPVKVGVSNDAAARLSQLQTGRDELLYIYAEEKCLATHAIALEHLVHRQLSHRRLVGEWFDIDVETAIAEVKFAIIRWESDEKLDMDLKKKRLRKMRRADQTR